MRRQRQQSDFAYGGQLLRESSVLLGEDDDEENELRDTIGEVVNNLADWEGEAPQGEK